jgi:hypothetical protein
MVPLAMVLLMQSSTLPSGLLLGSEARLAIVNKRWRTTPSALSVAPVYEWELQSRKSTPGSPFTLKIFMENGVILCRNARCPLFLSNYISLDSLNFEGVDEIFRDNTIYFVNRAACVMQNTWFTSAVDTTGMYDPYFIHRNIPLMRSVAVKS